MNKQIKLTDIFSNANKIMEIYYRMLQPLSKETALPVLALDVLLFIANNQEVATAKDICRYRGLKSGIVSVHIERLVHLELLERKNDIRDRRQTLLSYTNIACPIIDRGREIQKALVMNLFKGISEEERIALFNTLNKLNRNITEATEE